MSNWYVSESDSWYAPLQTQSAPQTTTKKKSRTWLRALIAVAVIVGLIVGSGAAVPARERAEGNGGAERIRLRPVYPASE